MSDLVYIEGLAVETTIGVHEWERQIRQALVFDIEMTCDFSNAAISDEVSDAVDYGAVARAVTELVQASDYQLLEALAEKVAARILHDFDVQAIRLKVSKAGAIPGAVDVGVIISRSR